MSSSLLDALFFLIRSLCGFFSVLLVLRFYMQALRIPFANPLGALVLPFTNWLVLPTRRFIPGLFGLDWASFLWLLIANMLEPLLILSLSNNPVALWWVPLIALHRVLHLHIYLLIGILLLQAILSWINPYSPIIEPLYRLSAPLLNPIRRFMPRTATIDLSPLVLIVLLQAVLIVL